MSEIIHVPVTLTMAQTGAAIALQVKDTAQAISAGLAYDVAISGTPYTGATEVTPTEQEQTLATEGLTMQDDVTVHAIPGDYVGSGIPHRDITDITVSADTVSVPAGYYADAASRAVASGSATTPTGGIEVTPSISVGSDGKITASVSKSETITPIVVPGYVNSGTAGTISISGSSSQQMTVRDSSDLVVRDDTVTVPAGYYPSEAAAGITPGSATTPATTISATPSISVSSGGLITSAVSASQQVTPTVSAGYISGGTAGTVSVSGSATEQLDTQAGTTITPTTSQQTAVAAWKYTTGDVLVDAMPAGVRGNGTISVTTSSTKKRYTLTYSSATSGYYPSSTVANPGYVELTRETKTATPTETAQDITPTGNYYFLENVTVDAIPDTYVGSAVPQKTSADLTASGATVTAPAGYYASSASKAVASGAVGLPYGSKGNVTDHTIKVTPFVTSVTGYITGETRTGNAVTVAASELVSGTKSITSNGTGIDVTNYAAVDVAVPSGSPNLQDKSVSYTPTESAQADTVTKDAGYDGLGEVSVSVGAISSTYVGSGITQRTSSDMSASGATVTAPAGYYASAGTKTIASGSATGPAAISSSGATLSTGSGTIILTKNVSVTPSVTPGYIASGTAGTTEITMQATCTLKGAQTYNVTTDYDQTIAAGTYLTGAQTFKKMMLQAKTVTTNGTYTPDAGFNGLGTVTVNVSGGGSVSVDTKTTTASNYPTSLSFSSMKGEPKMFVCRLNTGVSSSGSTTYYYIVEVAGAGTTCHGNVFRIGSTRQVNNITTGYSFAYSGTTLTITSSAASRSASPGAFYNGSYELIYVY